MKSPQEVFADYLAEKNLKTTPQRRLILDTLLKQGGTSRPKSSMPR